MPVSPTKLFPVGAPQVNVVPGEGTIPFRTSVGVTRKASPLQIVALMGVIIAVEKLSVLHLLMF